MIDIAPWAPRVVTLRDDAGHALGFAIRGQSGAEVKRFPLDYGMVQGWLKNYWTSWGNGWSLRAAVRVLQE